MDEPCSSLDPIATAKIEELISRLSADVTIGLVTTTCSRPPGLGLHRFLPPGPGPATGELIEYGPTAQLFDTPDDPRTKAYVSVRSAEANSTLVFALSGPMLEVRSSDGRECRRAGDRTQGNRDDSTSPKVSPTGAAEELAVAEVDEESR